MSFTEGLHYEMVWWERLDHEQKIHAFGKCPSLRIVPVAGRADDDRL